MLRKCVAAADSKALILSTTMPVLGFDREVSARIYLRIPLGAVSQAARGSSFGFAVDQKRQKELDLFGHRDQIELPSLVNLSFDHLGLNRVSVNGFDGFKRADRLNANGEPESEDDGHGPVFWLGLAVLGGIAGYAIYKAVDGDDDDTAPTGSDAPGGGGGGGGGIF